MSPDSEDSAPRAGLIVCFLFSPFSISSLFKFFFSFIALVRLDRTLMRYTSLNVYAHNTWGLLLQKLIIIFRASSSQTYVSFSHMYLFFAIICTFMT